MDSSAKTDVSPALPRLLGAAWVLGGGLLALASAGLFASLRTGASREVGSVLLLKVGRVAASGDLIASFLLIALAVGLMGRKRWAYRLGLLASWFGVLGGFLALSTALLLGGASLLGGGAKMDLRSLGYLPHFSFALFTILGTGVAALLSLFYLNHPRVKALFDSGAGSSWTDRVPLGALGYGMLLAVLSLAMGALAYLSGGVFPFFGSLWTGFQAEAAYLFFAVAWATLAAGVCRHRRMEWMLSMFVGTALAASVVRTFFSVEVEDFFRAVGVSGLQFEFFNRLGVSNVAVLTVLVTGLYAAFMTFWLWNEKSFRDTGDYLKIQEAGFFLDERIQVGLAVVLGVLVGAGVYAFQEQHARDRRVSEALEEADKPRRETEEALRDLASSGTRLKDAPLVLPFTDASGRTTSLGTALGYWATTRAADLVSGGFTASDADALYGGLGLFRDRAALTQATKDQAIARGWAKDFASGTLTVSGSTYLLRFRFWGTRPAKDYSITLAKGSLHLAPGLIAHCLCDWMGMRPTPSQVRDLSRPVFADEASFKRAAESAWMFQEAPAWVRGWNQVLPVGADDPYWTARWTEVRVAKGDLGVLNQAAALFQKDAPSFRSLEGAYRHGLLKARRYGAALHEALQALGRDDADADAYRTALDALEALKFHEQSAALAQAWAQRRPEGAEPLLRLAAVQRAWALEALPNGLTSAGTGESDRLYRERLKKGWAALQKALKAAPGDGRVYCALLDYGRFTGLETVEAKALYQKAAALLPGDPSPAGIYLEYLKPRAGGSSAALLAFAEGQRGAFPALYCKAWQESILLQCFDKDVSGDPEDCYRRMGDLVRKSPRWPAVESSFREALRRDPFDVDTWDNFLYWSQVVGQREAAFAYARGLAAQKSDRAALYPDVLMRAIEQEKRSKDTEEERSRVEARGDTVRLKTQALEMLTTLDPGDMRSWNLLAKHTASHGNLTLASKAFKALGDRWDPSVWGRDEFDKARQAVQHGKPYQVP